MTTYREALNILYPNIIRSTRSTPATSGVAFAPSPFYAEVSEAQIQDMRAFLKNPPPLSDATGDATAWDLWVEARIMEAARVEYAQAQEASKKREAAEMAQRERLAMQEIGEELSDLDAQKKTTAERERLRKEAAELLKSGKTPAGGWSKLKSLLGVGSSEPRRAA